MMTVAELIERLEEFEPSARLEIGAITAPPRWKDCTQLDDLVWLSYNEATGSVVIDVEI